MVGGVLSGSMGSRWWYVRNVCVFSLCKAEGSGHVEALLGWRIPRASLALSFARGSPQPTSSGTGREGRARAICGAYKSIRRKAE